MYFLLYHNSDLGRSKTMVCWQNAAQKQRNEQNWLLLPLLNLHPHYLVTSMHQDKSVDLCCSRIVCLGNRFSNFSLALRDTFSPPKFLPIWIFVWPWGINVPLGHHMRIINISRLNYFSKSLAVFPGDTKISILWALLPPASLAATTSAVHRLYLSQLLRHSSIPISVKYSIVPVF